MPYLSPQTPRWSPHDEAALVVAVREGLLVETHYFDLKASIPPGPSKNRELARDLASFAVDGGALLVGVGEGIGGSPELSPVALAGLAERVEQVARSIPDPPLPVACTAIAAEIGDGRGYLLVEIPATGTAPHMVDGVYMGRGDKTKVRLSDAEVVRLHQARERSEDTIARLVDDYVTRDPVPADQRRQAHLFVVAAPINPRPEMLLAVRPAGRWQPLLHQLLERGAYAPPLQVDSPFAPDLRSAGGFARRHDGAALTYNLTGARQLDSPSGRFTEDAVEFEVTEDGVIRILSTRLSDQTDEQGGQQVFEDVLPYFVRRTVGVASHICDVTGYLGPWAIGVAATGIAGLSAYGHGRLIPSRSATFGTDQKEYRRYTTASALELNQTPGAITARLAGRFLRSIGFEESPRVKPIITDPAPDEMDGSG